MKKHITTIILFLVFFAGLSLLLYPTFSDWWNSFHQSQMIASYEHTVMQVDNDTYDVMLDDARAFNQRLLNSHSALLKLTDEEQAVYDSLLDISQTGVMSYVEIPSIQIKLPIYHGTDEGVLQIAVGHLEGSSLPVGGKGTHCVVSGHRGLPSARLFTDIDRLVPGDEFLLHTLDEVLTYEVDLIQIVLPSEVSGLQIDPNEDYCTLVTCTPYGINTHRLLVRGHRIDTVNSPAVRVIADALQIRPVVVAPFVAAPILLGLLLMLLFNPGQKRKDNK